MAAMSYSESRLSWTNSMIVSLIQGYQKHPELWDPSNESYRIFPTKYEAWEDIASVFGVEVFDVKKKLNSILASHRRERAKIRNGGRSNWVLYDHLSFVPMHIDNPPASEVKTPEKVYYEDMDDDPPAHDDDDDDAVHHEEHEPEYLDLAAEDRLQEEEIFIKQEHKPTKPLGSSKKTRRSLKLRPIKRKLVASKEEVSPPVSPEKQNSIGLDARVLQALKNIRKADLLKKKDECDSFGEYIANSLRKHNERTRSMIKHAINNILFEQEMKKFSYSQVHLTDMHSAEENPLILSDLQET